MFKSLVLLLLLVFAWCVNLDAQSNTVVAGYYTSWRVFTYKPADIPMDRVTHLLHAFVYPDANGNVNYPTYFFDPMPALITLSHAAGVKVFVAVGGYNDSQYFSPMAANPTTRAAFIANITNFCTTHGYDGVDLDWEYPETADDRSNLNLLVSELKAYWSAHSLNYGVSMAIPALDWNGQFIDVATLAPYVEWFGVMTYDYYGNWSANSGHNSPLFLDPADPLQAGSVDFSIENYYIAQRGVPANKLVCGIPFYGKEFAKASEPYHSYTGRVKTWRYDEIMEMSGFTVKWDPVAYASYLSKSTSFITYSNERAVTEVCLYAKSKGIKGVMMWELSQDILPDESQPLLETIGYEMLYNNPISVEVTDFTAAEWVGAVEIKWMVHVENAGFNLYRSKTIAGHYERINSELIGTDEDAAGNVYRFIDHPQHSGCYWYKLEAVSLEGVCTVYGPISTMVSSIDGESVFPEEIVLHQNYPNPFNPQTSIRFDLPKDALVTLEIYDILGNRVRLLVNENRIAGAHSVIWNGMNDFGSPVAAGVYTCRLSTNDLMKTHKMILMK